MANPTTRFSLLVAVCVSLAGCVDGTTSHRTELPVSSGTGGPVATAPEEDDLFGHSRADLKFSNDFTLTPFQNDPDVRTLYGTVTSSEKDVIVSAVVEGFFMSEENAIYRRSTEGTVPEIKFMVKAIPPGGPYRFAVKLEDFNPAAELALKKTKFVVRVAQLLEKAVPVEIDSSSIAMDDAGAKLTCKVKNTGPNKLHNVMVRVEILDGDGRLLGEVEGAADVVGVLSPGETATFTGKFADPILGRVGQFAARSYGQISPSDK